MTFASPSSDGLIRASSLFSCNFSRHLVATLTSYSILKLLGALFELDSRDFRLSY